MRVLKTETFALLTCLVLFSAPSYAESWSKVIGLSNEMESWLSSSGSANDCLSLTNKDTTLYGGFVNSCPFKVQYTFCNYRPAKGSWTESFDCEKGKGGYDIIGANSKQAAHTRNTESTHWAACPWSDMEGKFLDISIDAQWDGQRKQYVFRCVLKNPEKKDKADKKDKKEEPQDEEPVALIRRGGSTGTDMFKQAITKAEQAEREEKERVARLERERIEQEKLERERIEREKREREPARQDVNKSRTQPQVASSYSKQPSIGSSTSLEDYVCESEVEKYKSTPEFRREIRQYSREYQQEQLSQRPPKRGGLGKILQSYVDNGAFTEGTKGRFSINDPRALDEWATNLDRIIRQGCLPDDYGTWCVSRPYVLCYIREWRKTFK